MPRHLLSHPEKILLSFLVTRAVERKQNERKHSKKPLYPAVVVKSPKGKRARDLDESFSEEEESLTPKRRRCESNSRAEELQSAFAASLNAQIARLEQENATLKEELKEVCYRMDAIIKEKNDIAEERSYLKGRLEAFANK